MHSISDRTTHSPITTTYQNRLPQNTSSQTSSGLQITAGQLDTYTPSSGESLGLYNPRMFVANGNQGGHAVASPTVRNATGTQFSQLDPAKQREAFTKRMGAAGVKASNPPTEAQLQAYFKTFDSKDKRAQAAQEFQDYAGAFHVHEANSDRPGDVQYSAEKTYVVGDKTFSNQAEAQKEADKVRKDWVEVPTFDASSWKDVSGRPKHSDGRHIQDCEGYAYMAQNLLGAAGYKSTQVAGGGMDNGHAMAVLRNPDGGDSVVVSNDKTFAGKTEQAALKQGWDYATGGGQPVPKWYRGDTQAQAQARMAAVEDK